MTHIRIRCCQLILRDKPPFAALLISVVVGPFA